MRLPEVEWITLLTNNKMRTLARVLNKYEPSAIPQAFGAHWLYTHRWKASHALYVQELLQKLQNGKSFQGATKQG